jgi:hypothetical protein
MTLNEGSLKYVLNRKYEILCSTFYMGLQFTQKIQIIIGPIDKSPSVLIE